MKYFSSLFAKATLFALSYSVIFYLIQFILVKNEVFAVEPTAANLSLWDVGFYDSLRKGGYDVHSNNTGFFMLFPLVWRISHLDVWGICALNTIFFSIGFGLLMRTLKEENRVFWLLCLTLPPAFHFFIPYTESLTFLLCSLAFYAVQEKKYRLLWIALFLASLVRSTGYFLIPAFIAMELLSHPPKEWFKSLMRSLIRYVSPVLLAMAIMIVWQYLATGVWFIYFKTQAKNWNHIFSLPGVPFSNVEDGDWRYHWLSALAMLIDTVALIFIIWQGVLWFKQKNLKDEKVILAAGYQTMVLMVLLFFSPKYGTNTTFIMGASRYTMLTPFFFVFLHYLNRQNFNKKHILYFFLFAHAFWVLFGAYHGLSEYLAFAMISTLLITAFMFYRFSVKYDWLVIPIIAFNLFMQLHMFQQFISQRFVD